MGPKKVQKQERNENTKRLSCYREVVVKKDWKTTLLLVQKSRGKERLEDYSTSVAKIKPGNRVE